MDGEAKTRVVKSSAAGNSTTGKGTKAKSTPIKTYLKVGKWIGESVS